MKLGTTSHGRHRQPVATCLTMSRAVIAGLIICTSLALGGEREPGEPVPQRVEVGGAVLVCKEPVYDFGTVWSSDPVKHTFDIENVGTDRAWIRPVPAIGGTVAPTYYAIDPGEVFGYVATLRTGGMRARVKKMIHMVVGTPPTYPPEGPVLVCEEPDHDFGTFQPGDTLYHEFKVRNVSRQTVWFVPRQHWSGTSQWGSRPFKAHPGATVTVPVTLKPRHIYPPGAVEWKISLRLVPPPDVHREDDPRRRASVPGNPAGETRVTRRGHLRMIADG